MLCGSLQLAVREGLGDFGSWTGRLRMQRQASLSKGCGTCTITIEMLRFRNCAHAYKKCTAWHPTDAQLPLQRLPRKVTQIIQQHVEFLAIMTDCRQAMSQLQRLAGAGVHNSECHHQSSALVGKLPAAANSGILLIKATLAPLSVGTFTMHKPVRQPLPIRRPAVRHTDRQLQNCQRRLNRLAVWHL